MRDVFDLGYTFRYTIALMRVSRRGPETCPPEKGLARSGNGRVRRGMIQLAWRFLTHQKHSALAQWFRARTENARGTRKPMIVALARKLLIALWRLVRQGVVPDGVVLRPAQ
jgi:transposase